MCVCEYVYMLTCVHCVCKCVRACMSVYMCAYAFTILKTPSMEIIPRKTSEFQNPTYPLIQHVSSIFLLSLQHICFVFTTHI